MNSLHRKNHWRRILAMLIACVLLVGTGSALAKGLVEMDSRKYYGVFLEVYEGYTPLEDVPTGTGPKAGESWSIGDLEATRGGESYYVVNCKEWVSLREEASTDSSRIRKVYYGEEVYVLGTWRSWALIFDYENDRYGWILQEYLSTRKPSARPGNSGGTSNPYDLSNYGYRYVTTKGRGALVFQKEPYGSFLRDFKYYDDDLVFVNLSYRNGMYALAYENGTYGYVDASYIDWTDYSGMTYSEESYDDSDDGCDYDLDPDGDYWYTSMELFDCLDQPVSPMAAAHGLSYYDLVPVGGDDAMKEGYTDGLNVDIIGDDQWGVCRIELKGSLGGYTLAGASVGMDTYTAYNAVCNYFSENGSLFEYYACNFSDEYFDVYFEMYNCAAGILTAHYSNNRVTSIDVQLL